MGVSLIYLNFVSSHFLGHLEYDDAELSVAKEDVNSNGHWDL